MTTLKDVTEKVLDAAAKCADLCKGTPDSLKTTHYSQAGLNLLHMLERAIDCQHKIAILEVQQVELAIKKFELAKKQAELLDKPSETQKKAS